MTASSRVPSIGAAIAVALALGACRSSAPPERAADNHEPPVTVTPAEPGVPAFEQHHRQAAQAATREGRLADARWHWDVIAALHPDDAHAQRERRRVEDAARAAADDRAAQARTARRRGDVDAARRLNLEALRAWPLHAGAADELRALERERTRRGSVQALHAMRRETRTSTSADASTSAVASTTADAPIRRRSASKASATGRPPSAGTTKTAARSARVVDSPEARNEAEHAVLMAQTDATDRDAPDRAAPTDADACRRAPLLESSDTDAAVRAWQQCLKARPGDARATARLKALRR